MLICIISSQDSSIKAFYSQLLMARVFFWHWSIIGDLEDEKFQTMNFRIQNTIVTSHSVGLFQAKFYEKTYRKYFCIKLASAPRVHAGADELSEFHRKVFYPESNTIPSARRFHPANGFGSRKAVPTSVVSSTPIPRYISFLETSSRVGSEFT